MGGAEGAAVVVAAGAQPDADAFAVDAVGAGQRLACAGLHGALAHQAEAAGCGLRASGRGRGAGGGGQLEAHLLRQLVPGQAGHGSSVALDLLQSGHQMGPAALWELSGQLVQQ